MTLKYLNKDSVLEQLRHGLVVSIQPEDDSPLNEPNIIALTAKAAINGGAVGVRIEGVENVSIARSCGFDGIIVGIVKRKDPKQDVIITPSVQDVKDLALAGATIIAVDGTNRNRLTTRDDLLEAIHQAGCVAMADCSCPNDADYCASIGFDIIGTTLSGYTEGIPPKTPDLNLVNYLASEGYYVMAEGRYNTPELCIEAIKFGAKCVTVGTVLTRFQKMTNSFATAIDRAVQK